MIAVDSDVFLSAKVFSGKDERSRKSNEFLVAVTGGNMCTTVINVFEVCGVAGPHLEEEELRKWLHNFRGTFGVQILLPRDAALPLGSFFRILPTILFGKLHKGMRFGDALIIGIVEGHPEIREFVTWNVKDFDGRTRLRVSSPADYLARVR
ncbi:hypothetical protein HYS50_00535 [Candidatus Woesearchaeota archaeon]|nr:hypothetical protein [Candidatus Woesearchaeota archaeon]